MTGDRLRRSKPGYDAPFTESTLTTPSSIRQANAISTESSVAPAPRNDFSARHNDAGFCGRVPPILRRLSVSLLIVAGEPGDITADAFFAAGAAACFASAFFAGAFFAGVFFAGAFLATGAAVFFADACLTAGCATTAFFAGTPFSAGAFEASFVATFLPAGFAAAGVFTDKAGLTGPCPT